MIIPWIISSVFLIGNTPASIRFQHSSSGKISGFITNKETGHPIPDANIVISNTSWGTASQDGGYYFIDHIPTGIYQITIQVVGYRNETRKEVTICQNTTLNFKLIPEVIQFDPILVTATRSDHLQSMVTVSSDVLTPQRIAQETGNTVGEITESLAGVYTKNYDGFAGPQTPSIRGANPDQVLVLLDDQRLNTAQGGGVDLNMFPIEAIERVEVLRGGHSALLGTDAIGGVIHIVSRESVPLKGFTYGTRTTFGSFGTRMVNFYGGHRFGPLSYFLTVNQSRSDGNFNYKALETGEEKRRENNDYKGNNIFFKTRLDVAKGHQIRFLFQSQDTERGVIGSVDWPSPQARRDENRKLFTLRSENQMASRWRLKEQIYYNTYDNHYMNPGGWIPEDDLHQTTAFGLDLQAQWTPHPHLTFTTGSEWRQDKLKSTKFTKTERSTQGYFVQGELSYSLSLLGLKTKWRWIPALRWNHYSDVEAKTCPKLGVLMTTGDQTSISLKGNIGTSYRVPTFFDLYWPEDDYTRGNAALLPESSTNLDIGLVFRSKRSSFLQLESTYFQNDFKDLILWEPGDDWKWAPQNVGKAFILGLENTFTFRLPENRYYIIIAHTMMKATNETPGSEQEGNRLIYRPNTKLDISSGFNAGPINVNINYRIVGKRFTDPDNAQELALYQLLNGNIGATFSIGKFEINTKLQALNLLNKSIYLLDGYPLPGREFRFSMGFEY